MGAFVVKSLTDNSLCHIIFSCKCMFPILSIYPALSISPMSYALVYTPSIS